MNTTQETITSAPLTAPAMDKVRWGLIGVGHRGYLAHLKTILKMKNAEIVAVCDNLASNVERAATTVREKTEKDPATYGGDGDNEAWKRLLERDDIDAVVISTEWGQHAPMGVDAMKAGKHAFLEVPAATSLEECWEMVDTSEATGKHCMMLENCNYAREELMLLNMVKQGVFGEVLHAEAAYLHDLRRQLFNEEHGEGSWRTYCLAERQGNLYPTHGVGPVAHCMDVNRGDYFDYIVSMSSPARGRELFAKEHFEPDHKWNQIKNWRCGDVNTSIIKLMSGKTLMVQWDETSPRPYSRHNYIQGTRGAFGGYPNRIALDYALEDLPEGVRASAFKKDGRTDYHQWDNHLEPWLYTYDHPMWKKVGKIAEEHGGHGGSDYIMFWRIHQCLLEGKPMDQSVYDGALWSSITPLSEQSVDSGSTPLKFPDFTRGKWKTTAPIEISEF